MLMQRLGSYLSTRRRDKVDQLARSHLAKVTDVVEALERMINEWIINNTERIDKIGQLIDEEERSADVIREEIVIELTKSEIPAKEREDLLHTIRRLDSCANFCKSASRNLRLLKMINIPTVFREKSLEMVKLLVLQIRALTKAFNTYERKKVLLTQKHLLEVSKWEHDMDECYFSAKSLLLYTELPPAALLFLKDILRDIEMAADFVEDTGDYMKVLLVKISKENQLE